MTNRERAMRILHYEPVDRLPAVHFGYWAELLEEWAAEGKISRELAVSVGDGNDADRELDKILGWDFNWFNRRGCSMNLFPPFEELDLEILPDGSRRRQTRDGTVVRVKPGLNSIPSEDDYLLKDRDAFESLFKPKMQFMQERIDLEAFKNFNETRPQDVPICLNAGSIMGKIRDMCTVTGLSYLIYDEDETLFADIVNTFAEMQYQCLEAVLATGAKFDFAHYWEDICFKNGPMIAPGLFRELCAGHYQKRTELFHRYGIDIISLDCDGVTEKLLPIWVENGVNTMFPIEVGTWGDQFALHAGNTERPCGVLAVWTRRYSARIKPLWMKNWSGFAALWHWAVSFLVPTIA